VVEDLERVAEMVEAVAQVLRVQVIACADRQAKEPHMHYLPDPDDMAAKAVAAILERPDLF
jgi:hypothetical protein